LTRHMDPSLLSALVTSVDQTHGPQSAV